MEYPPHLSERDVARLQTAGVDGYEAYSYCEVGVSTFAEAQEWKAAGIGGDEALEYDNAGVATFDEAQEWKAAGIDGREAYWYHVAGVSTLAEAREWKAAGIGAGEAHGYRNVGVATLDELRQLATAGIGGYEVHRYREVGVATFDEMLRLTKMGGTPSSYADIASVREQFGDAVVNRVLAVGDDLNRFPVGTLAALSRSTRLGDVLLAASDDHLQVAVVLAEDHYASTGKVSVPFIRESIGLL